MSVARIDGWRLAGCGSFCRPRSHDPASHEEYGRLLERGVLHRLVVRTGPLVVDLRTERVTVNGAEVHLSGREWGVLAYMAERPGQWHPIEAIIRAVWGSEWITRLRRRNPNGGVYRADLRPHAVTEHRLRYKLGPAASLIESQRSMRGLRRLRIEEPT